MVSRDKEFFEALSNALLERGFSSVRRLIILGSGWTPDPQDLNIVYRAMSPGISEILGHTREVLIVSPRNCSGPLTALVCGRRHFYESSAEETNVGFIMDTFRKLGLEEVLITITGGLVDRSFSEGTVFLIRGMLNFQRANFSPQAVRFVQNQPLEKEIDLPRGHIVCGNYGPTYETPAETSFFLKHLPNLSIVGMSPGYEIYEAASRGIPCSLLCLGVLYAPLSFDCFAKKICGDLSHEVVVERSRTVQDFVLSLLEH